VHVPIFLRRPLGLEIIASRWAQEDAAPDWGLDGALVCLLFAVAYDDLIPTEPQMQVIAQTRLEEIRDRYALAEDVIFDTNEMLEIAGLIMVDREAFFRWVAAEEVYPRPTFWGPPAAAQQARQKLKREAPERERVKAGMRAKVDAGEAAPEDVRRNKEYWAAELGCTPTTAREAGLELWEELTQEK
jgi:hypothetical protein